MRANLSVSCASLGMIFTSTVDDTSALCLNSSKPAPRPNISGNVILAICLRPAIRPEKSVRNGTEATVSLASWRIEFPNLQNPFTGDLSLKKYIDELHKGFGSLFNRNRNHYQTPPSPYRSLFVTSNIFSDVVPAFSAISAIFSRPVRVVRVLSFDNDAINLSDAFADPSSCISRSVA